MKYVFITILIVLIITIIFLFISLGKLMKKLATTVSKTNKLNCNIEEMNNKTEKISKTKNSWKFFTSILIILTILKETLDDYKTAKKHKKNLVKSLSKTCARNVTKISKIKFV